MVSLVYASKAGAHQSYLCHYGYAKEFITRHRGRRILQYRQPLRPSNIKFANDMPWVEGAAFHAPAHKGPLGAVIEYPAYTVVD